MRTIRRLLMLAVLGVGGIAAFNYWSAVGWPRVSRPAAADARQYASQLANHAVIKASNVANKVGHTMDASALTAKIKSKMALDDRVNARAIDVDTTGSVVTLSGTVASRDMRDRAERLARDTEGVTQVVDKLRVRSERRAKN